MFIRIEPSSSVPIYRQIADQIRYQIAAGILKEGDKVPSVRELALQVAVNQNTILRVYERLTSAGLLEMRHGQGTFVTTGAKDDQIAAHRARLVDELRQLGCQSLALGLSPNELHGLLDRAIEQLAATAPAGPSDTAPEELSP